MKKIIVITGPTGIGKTKLSIALAKKYHGEVINGDAIQIYKGMDIGSGKVTEWEMDGIRHHLFSIKSVYEDYTIYDYQIECRKKIDEIFSRGNVVIIVGGTGLYIKSALYNYTLSKKDISKNEYSNLTTEEIYNKLISVDKNIKIDKYNRPRLVRALNYYLSTGESISCNNDGNRLLYDAIFIGLTSDRDRLYDRINKRVDMMLDNGLIKEVKSFYDKNIRTKPIVQGIGYKELYAYFDKEISYLEAINLIKRNSRRYAKRQYTFFNNQFNITWFNTYFDNFDKTVSEVITYLDKNL